SEYGDQFTEDQAQYAIDTIDADWNQNALESAKVYQDEMAMSPDAIRDQLSSEYGDQFTEDHAQYAVDNLCAPGNRTSLSSRSCGTPPPGPRRRPQEGLAGIRPGGPFLSAGPRPCWSFALLSLVAAGPRRCWALALLGLGAAGPWRCWASS